MRRLWVHAALLTAIAMWGLVFIAVFELIQTVDAVQLVTIRFYIGALGFAVLLASYRRIRLRLRGGERWRFLVLAFFAVPGSQVAVVHGQRYLSPALVALVMTSSPAFAAVIASLFLGERVTARKLAGFALALGGAGIIITFGAGTGADLTVTNPWGGAIVLVSAVSWAIYTVLSKPIAGRHPPLGSVATVLVLGTLMLLPLTPHAAAGAGNITSSGWAWMLYLAFGGTVLPYIVWMGSLRHLQASQTVAYMYLIPVFALIWGVVFLGQIPTATALAGGVLVIIGVALTQFGAAAAPPVAAVAPAVPARPDDDPA